MASEIEAWQRKAYSSPCSLKSPSWLTKQEMPEMVNANLQTTWGKAGESRRIVPSMMLSGDRWSKVTYKRLCKWDSWASTQLPFPRLKPPLTWGEGCFLTESIDLHHGCESGCSNRGAGTTHRETQGWLLLCCHPHVPWQITLAQAEGPQSHLFAHLSRPKEVGTFLSKHRKRWQPMVSR